MKSKSPLTFEVFDNELTAERGGSTISIELSATRSNLLVWLYDSLTDSHTFETLVYSYLLGLMNGQCVNSLGEVESFWRVGRVATIA